MSPVKDDILRAAEIGEISARVANCLLRKGIRSFQEIQDAWNVQNLLSLKNFGQDSLYVLYSVMQERGLTIKGCHWEMMTNHASTWGAPEYTLDEVRDLDRTTLLDLRLRDFGRMIKAQGSTCAVFSNLHQCPLYVDVKDWGHPRNLDLTVRQIIDWMRLPKTTRKSIGLGASGYRKLTPIFEALDLWQLDG